MAQKYYLPGYTPPPEIFDLNRVKEVQRALGIEATAFGGQRRNMRTILPAVHPWQATSASIPAR